MRGIDSRIEGAESRLKLLPEEPCCSSRKGEEREVERGETNRRERKKEGKVRR